MSGYLRENFRPVFLSVALHGGVIAALILMANFSLQVSSPDLQPLPINATLVDSRVVRAAQQAQLAAAAAAAAAQQRQRQQQMQQQQMQQQAAAQARAAAQAQAAEAASLRAQATQRAADAAAAVRAAEVRQAEEAKRAAGALRQAEAKRAAQALQQAEARRAALARQLADQRARADLQRQIAAEEHRQAVEQGPLADQYRASLVNRIEHAWIKPPTARLGIDCRVEVMQVPGGEVTSAHVTTCNGDAAVRQSIENAVYRASPLPDPPDPALFQRQFVFEFKPDE